MIYFQIQVNFIYQFQELYNLIIKYSLMSVHSFFLNLFLILLYLSQF
jgi:hypothetical protein